MKKTLLVLCLAAASCTSFRDMATNAAKDAVVSYLHDHAPAEIRQQADTDKSGITTWDEWKAWILGGGGLSFVLAWLGLSNKTTATKLSSAKKDIWTGIKELETKVATKP